MGQKLKLASLLLISYAPEAAAQSARVPLSPQITPSKPIVIDPRLRVNLPPAVDVTQQQIAKLQNELAETQADLAQLRTEFTIYKKLAEILTDRANATDARFAKHTHRYNYNGVNFTTKWFVTSGRPIVNDEKTDYATVITGTPSYVGETTAPVAAK